MFEINDTVFALFEMKDSKKLVAFDTKVVEDNLRESIIDSIASDDDIHFLWILKPKTRVLKQRIRLGLFTICVEILPTNQEATG